MHSRRLIAVGAAAALGTVEAVALADVSVAVDTTKDVHPISPLVYGINFPSDAQLASKAITVSRRGGNATSRYNYLVDFHNTGADYFFENIPDCGGCSDPKAQSSANKFLDQTANAGLVALFTMPTIGVMPKASSPTSHPYACGCPKTVTANQECFDPYDTNCGDGRVGGACGRGTTWVTCAAVSATSETSSPDFIKGWAVYLAGKYGAAAGKRIYELDNEPMLWNSTHYDVHPEPLGYDELWQRMRDYGAAIVAGNPSAELAGPVEWGWPNYLCSAKDDISKGCSASSPDRAAHGGVELTAWVLDQAKAYEQANGKRILHYLDLHYYPQGGNPPDTTRSLWDPNYTDPSWINAKIRLIPRMRDWVAQHYPGTKLSISEYDFYDHDSARGAVTYAEVLGIFGREGLDMATAWSPPAATERSFAAFRIFRNYDGAGAHFESTNARATVTGAGVSAFAATGTTGVTVVLVNEGAAATTAHLSLAGFSAGTTAQVYSNDGNATIAKKANATVTGSALDVPLGATSVTLVRVPQSTGGGGGSGGAPGSGGAGSGGAASGGATGSGGTLSSGGATASGGAAASGGAVASGGTNGGGAGASNGGSTAGSSGATASGGAAMTDAGLSAGGAVVGAGGSLLGGGTSSTGNGGTLGVAGAGGAPSIGGGFPSLGGSSGVGGTAAAAASSDEPGGCACRVVPASRAGGSPFGAAGALGLALGFTRRLRRGRARVR